MSVTIKEKQAVYKGISEQQKIETFGQLKLALKRCFRL